MQTSIRDSTLRTEQPARWQSFEQHTKKGSIFFSDTWIWTVEALSFRWKNQTN